tara:strand:+ start:474 stop:1583 length:1110 start_codon:yes stop_codon:yes gene_type:complete
MKLKDIDVSKNPLNYFLYLKYLYINKNIILLSSSIFLFIGILVSLNSDIEYKSSTIIVPQSNSSNNFNQISTIASIAGIDLGDNNSNENISPTLYPMLIQNISFRKKIIREKLDFIEYDEPISFKDYFNKKTNKKFFFIQFLEFIISIPQLLKNIIFSSNNIDSSIIENKLYDSENYISPEEDEIMRTFSSRVKLELYPRDSYIEISAIMPDPVVASQLANKTRMRLQDEIIKIKIKKAQAKLDFLLSRLSDKKSEYDKTKSRLASFKEKNKSITSIFQENKLNELISENNLSFSIYSEIQKQIENQRIKIKEDTPVFTIIKEPTIPLERFKPKRTTIVLNYLFAGFLISVLFLFSKTLIIRITKILIK